MKEGEVLVPFSQVMDGSVDTNPPRKITVSGKFGQFGQREIRNATFQLAMQNIAKYGMPDVSFFSVSNSIDDKDDPLPSWAMMAARNTIRDAMQYHRTVAKAKYHFTRGPWGRKLSFHETGENVVSHIVRLYGDALHLSTIYGDKSQEMVSKIIEAIAVRDHRLMPGPGVLDLPPTSRIVKDGQLVEPGAYISPLFYNPYIRQNFNIKFDEDESRYAFLAQSSNFRDANA